MNTLMSSRDIRAECETFRRLLSRGVRGAGSSDAAVRFLRTRSAANNIYRLIILMASECVSFETVN